MLAFPAVMPSTLCSACTASAAAVSLQYARLAPPSTRFQFFHTFPCKECCKVYSLTADDFSLAETAVFFGVNNGQNRVCNITQSPVPNDVWQDNTKLCRWQTRQPSGTGRNREHSVFIRHGLPPVHLRTVQHTALAELQPID